MVRALDKADGMLTLSSAL